MKLMAHLAFATFMVATLPVHSADDAGEPEARRIASRFVQLAGSEDNALALVLALRHGARVQLVADSAGERLPESAMVEVPACAMPWNEVRITLLHAQDQLLRAGITRPTPAALQASLLGGDVVGENGRRITVRGILRMRGDGLSWVDIARVTSPPSAAPAFLGR